MKKLLDKYRRWKSGEEIEVSTEFEITPLSIISFLVFIIVIYYLIWGHK